MGVIGGMQNRPQDAVRQIGPGQRSWMLTLTSMGHILHPITAEKYQAKRRICGSPGRWVNLKAFANARQPVVTASVDYMSFLTPVHLG